VRDGVVTASLNAFKLVCRQLLARYGDLPVNEFKPADLRILRQQMVDNDISLTVINQRIGRIRHIFRWGAGDAPGEGLVKPETVVALQMLRDLRAGRGQARETEPVEAADEESFWAVMPYLSKPLRGLLQLVYWTGMRPGEVCRLRGQDLDLQGSDGFGRKHEGLWCYRVPAKMAHCRSRSKQWQYYFLGPEAQEVLKPWLRDSPGEYCFQPRDAHRLEGEERCRRRRPETRVRPRQTRPSNTLPSKPYPVSAVAQSVRRAIQRINQERAACGIKLIKPWHPHCLRHNAEQRIERLGGHGMEGSRVVLGHESLNITKVYGSRDMALAAEIMKRLG
jgi:integrase